MLQAVLRVLLTGSVAAALTLSVACAHDAPGASAKALAATGNGAGTPAQGPTGAQSEAADPAAHQIEVFYDSLTKAMKGGARLGFGGRYKLLEPTIKQVFNLPYMTRFVFGPTWLSIPQTDQSGLVEAFTRMTISSYASNFDSYDGQKFVVDPKVQARGRDKVVISKMIDPKASDPSDATVVFDYLMREEDGQWQVIDILLNGSIDQLAKQNRDFASTVSGSGAKGLIDKLNSLSEKLKSSD